MGSLDLHMDLSICFGKGWLALEYKTAKHIGYASSFWRGKVKVILSVC